MAARFVAVSRCMNCVTATIPQLGRPSKSAAKRKNNNNKKKSSDFFHSQCATIFVHRRSLLRLIPFGIYIPESWEHRWLDHEQASVFQLAWCANRGGVNRVKHPCASPRRSYECRQCQYNTWLQTNERSRFRVVNVIVCCLLFTEAIAKNKPAWFLFKCISLALPSLFVLFCFDCWFVYLRRAEKDCCQRGVTLRECINVLGAPDCVKAKSLVFNVVYVLLPVEAFSSNTTVHMTVALSSWCHFSMCREQFNG